MIGFQLKQVWPQAEESCSTIPFFNLEWEIMTIVFGSLVIMYFYFKKKRK